MEFLLRILLTLLYPLLIGARVLNALRGRDPLRLREPAGSCWVPRPASARPRTYFSEADLRERPYLVERIMTRLSRPFTPRVSAAAPVERAAMPAELPDEVYTLW